MVTPVSIRLLAEEEDESSKSDGCDILKIVVVAGEG